MLPFCVKLFPHWSHEYGFSPVWTNLCFFRSPDQLNLLSQCEHLYCFSPVWMFMCTLRLNDCVKLFPHWSQVYGFSPVWTLKWTSRLYLHVKFFPQWVQVKDFLALLFFKSLCLVWEHLKCFSPVLTWFVSSTSLNSWFSSLSSINSKIKAKTVHLSVTWKNKKRNVRVHKSEPWCNSVNTISIQNVVAFDAVLFQPWNF